MARYSPVEAIGEDEFRALLAVNPTSFSQTAGYYRLVAKVAGTMVGTILLKCEDPNRSQVEIGYAIKDEYQAQGLGYEMVAAACQQIFASSSFSIIWAKVHKENFASIRILEKVGFTERWSEPTGDILVFCLDR